MNLCAVICKKNQYKSFGANALTPPTRNRARCWIDVGSSLKLHRDRQLICNCVTLYTHIYPSRFLGGESQHLVYPPTICVFLNDHFYFKINDFDILLLILLLSEAVFNSIRWITNRRNLSVMHTLIVSILYTVI